MAELNNITVFLVMASFPAVIIDRRKPLKKNEQSAYRLLFDSNKRLYIAITTVVDTTLLASRGEYP